MLVTVYHRLKVPSYFFRLLESFSSDTRRGEAMKIDE